MRAVAVLLVIAFHWQVGGFEGGFVGVDVFFVVSGYLITKLIAGPIFDGSFSFAQFYTRRARRLLPALYVVLLASLIVGWSLLLPTTLLDLGRSAIAVLLFASNLWFWQQTGYFDAPALDKPLLHAWSLSVEEQFYFIVPVSLWLLARVFPNRRPWVVAVLAVTAIASFALCCWQTKWYPSAAFYLPTARAWEFFIGAGILLIEGRKANAILGLLGVAMIIVAGLGFSHSTPFPGPAALLPCLGTAFVVWARWVPSSTLGATAINSGAFIGRLSYSLYLWHWPVYVFARFQAGRENDLSDGTKIALFALTVALSLVTYFLVETPFRARRRLADNRTFLRALLGSAVAIIALIGSAHFFQPLQGRYGAEAARISAYAADYPYPELFRQGTCFLRPEQSLTEYDRRDCFTVDPKRPNLLLWGDSMAAHYRPGLAAFAKARGIDLLQATASICPPILGIDIEGRPNCRAFNDGIAKLIEAHPEVTVVMSADWVSYEPNFGVERLTHALQSTLRWLVEHKIRTIVFGPSIRWRTEMPPLLARRAAENLDPHDTRALIVDAQFEADKRMKSTLSVPYISILDTMCPRRVCPAFAGNVPIAFDRIHLTREGSVLIIQSIAPQLDSLLTRD